MELNEYQDRARNTAIYPKEHGLTYTVLGLVGECGEIANKAKKIIRDHGGVLTDESRSILADELGDALWYLANVSFEVGVELETIADMNLTKLSARQASNTLKGDSRGKAAQDDIRSMMQSVLKEGDIVHCWNNYIIKSVDWGECTLILQKTVSQSLYQGFHPELWEVNVKGIHKDVWILPQDKVEQEEVILNDTPERTAADTPQEETPVENTPEGTTPEESPEEEEIEVIPKGEPVEIEANEPSNSDEEEDTTDELDNLLDKSQDEEEDALVDESLAAEEVAPEQEDGEFVGPEVDEDTPTAEPEPAEETPSESEPVDAPEESAEAPAEEAGSEPQPSEDEEEEEPVEQPSETSEREEE